MKSIYLFFMWFKALPHWSYNSWHFSKSRLLVLGFNRCLSVTKKQRVRCHRPENTNTVKMCVHFYNHLAAWMPLLQITLTVPWLTDNLHTSDKKKTKRTSSIDVPRHNQNSTLLRQQYLREKNLLTSSTLHSESWSAHNLSVTFLECNQGDHFLDSTAPCGLQDHK